MANVPARGTACVNVQGHQGVWYMKGREGNPCDWVQVARKRVVPGGTLGLHRGQGLQDFITHSKEIEHLTVRAVGDN